MTPTIHIFNPENDLALAHAKTYYAAPTFARQLRRDLALLPAWTANDGDFVLTEQEADALWIERLNNVYGLNVRTVAPCELKTLGHAKFHPWGWSEPLRRELFTLKVPAQDLPTAEAIEAMRQISHRRTSIAIHKALGGQLCEVPVECESWNDVKTYITQHNGKCYAKAPWSGSGKGVFHITDPHSDEFERWCKGVMIRQGSVICEPAYDRVLDFAVEFRNSNGHAEVSGLSVFESDFHNQYAHGLIASHKYLTSKITSRYPDFNAVLNSVRAMVESIVCPIYDSDFGVDMMLFNTGSHVGINPCVELNLRSTMGMITTALANKLRVDDDTQRYFKILYSADGDFNLGKETIALTPIYPHTRYCAVAMSRNDLTADESELF